jgi:DNA-binding NtrC family response regulator
MTVNEKPRILLVEDNADASTVLSGTLHLKGCEVYKTNDADSCLKVLSDLGGKVDVIVISHEVVGNKDMNLIISIRKINFETKIIVVANEGASKNSFIDYGADEVALRPMSPENMADKILMLMAREASIASKDR